MLFQERLKDLQRQYLEKVDAKTISDVGFHKFAKTFVQTSNELIGQKTSDGRLIKGITVHLPERIIGDGTKAHLPVSVEQVKDVLMHGKVTKERRESVVYRKDEIDVSFNTVNGVVIQCNIDKDDKKK